MRKRLLFINVVFIVLVFTFFVSPKKTRALNDLDVIEDYIVTVEPDFHDGTLKIDVVLNWKVLDDKTDGPLSWIKVGVPNFHVEALKAYTSNIKKIKYYEDDGAYIRIDLDRKYYQDEVVEMHFSWVQAYMYFLDGNIVRYDYNPGYFSEIKVENCVVRWLKKDVREISPSSLEPEEVDGYYVWTSSLDYNQYIKVNLLYDKMSFLELDEKMQYTDRYMSNLSLFMMIAVLGGLTALVIGICIYSYLQRDPYLRERGFIVHHVNIFPHHYPHHYYKSGVSSSGEPINPPTSIGGSGHGGAGGGCACACACACAGGGRAGCSMKDFYHTNLDSKKVIDITSKK